MAIGDGQGVFGLGQKIKKNELAAVSEATTKAFATKFRVARGSRIYKNVNTVPQRVRASFGNVKVHINPAPSGVGMDGHPVARRLLRLRESQMQF